MPSNLAATSRSYMDRFLSFVIPEPNSGCWLWLGSFGKDGYGKFYDGSKQKKCVVASRWSFEHFRGAIPDGMLVCHKCDIPCCVNPDHLFAGTWKDNMSDMISKGRDRYTGPKVHWSSKKTACPRGHSYSFTTKAPYYRYCRICTRASVRRRYAEARAKRGLLSEAPKTQKPPLA